jgi:hypothetical protein
MESVSGKEHSTTFSEKKKGGAWIFKEDAGKRFTAKGAKAPRRQTTKTPSHREIFVF